MKNKENALNDFKEMIEKSWTYNRLTDHEKKLWNNIIVGFAWENRPLYGNYKQRMEQLNNVYNAFLMGLGYTGGNWRQGHEVF